MKLFGHFSLQYDCQAVTHPNASQLATNHSVNFNIKVLSLNYKLYRGEPISGTVATQRQE